MVLRWSYLLDEHEMLKEIEILKKKRDEALQKWKEHVRTFDGITEYKYTYRSDYDFYVLTIKYFEKAINDGVSVRKCLRYVHNDMKMTTHDDMV
jgi:hypothetical protein